MTCVSATLQDDKLWLSFEPISITRLLKRPTPEAFAGVNIGINGATAEQAIHDNSTIGGGAALDMGGGIGESWYTPSGNGGSRNFEPYADFTFGEGWYVTGGQVESWRIF